MLFHGNKAQLQDFSQQNKKKTRYSRQQGAVRIDSTDMSIILDKKNPQHSRQLCAVKTI